jgi:predicted nucleotidyltransferase
MTKQEILTKLNEKKDFIQKEYGVKNIGLFGSYAKDQQSEDSDIDFYVEFKEKTFDNLAGLWVYLEELYHKKIDIVHKHKHSNKILIKRIEDEVVYG